MTHSTLQPPVLNNGRPVHLGFPSRCLVIEACVVPENVRTLLESK